MLRQVPVIIKDGSIRDDGRANNAHDNCEVFSNSEALGNSLAAITSFPRKRESRSAINQ